MDAWPAPRMREMSRGWVWRGGGEGLPLYPPDGGNNKKKNWRKNAKHGSSEIIFFFFFAILEFSKFHFFLDPLALLADSSVRVSAAPRCLFLLLLLLRLSLHFILSASLVRRFSPRGHGGQSAVPASDQSTVSCQAACCVFPSRAAGPSTAPRSSAAFRSAQSEFTFLRCWRAFAFSFFPFFFFPFSFSALSGLCVCARHHRLMQQFRPMWKSSRGLFFLFFFFFLATHDPFLLFLSLILNYWSSRNALNILRAIFKCIFNS